MFATLNQLSHHHAWRRQLEMLLDSAGDGIYGIDLAGRCIFINHAGAAMLGYTPDEVLGRNMHYLMHHTHADQRPYPVHDCRIFRAFQLGQGVRVDDEMLWRRDGSGFAAEYASHPIREDGAVVGAVVTFSDITERKRAEAVLAAEHLELERRVTARTADLSAANEHLRRTRNALQRLSAHLQTVREEERVRIARDVHDDLGAAFTAMQLDLSWLAGRITADDTARQRIEAMLELSGQAMDSVRRLISDLRPGVLEHLGLWAALEWALKDFEQRTSVAVTLGPALATLEVRLSPPAETAVYRIVQELLTNVTRHAQARSVSLAAQVGLDEVCIELADDGVGMTVAAAPTSFGLLGMHERARSLGGALVIDSAPGAGTRARLRVPLSAA
ncbi:hypothetical protein BH09PSE6_BH09PSE6_21810 [soil metagenome]